MRITPALAELLASYPEELHQCVIKVTQLAVGRIRNKRAVAHSGANVALGRCDRIGGLLLALTRNEMKNYLRAALVATAALFATFPASAADLPVRVAAPSVTVVREGVAYSWTGFYVGLQGGYAFSGRNTINDAGDLGSWNTRGAFGGLTVGANLQVGHVVFGLEADGSLAGIRANRSFDGVNIAIKPDYFGTARVRLGYDFNGLMPYVTGGFYGQRSKLTASGFGDSLSSSDTSFGWTAGAGVEYALTNNWSVKTEYLYARTGQQNFTLGGFGAGVESHQHFLRFGVNYKL